MQNSTRVVITGMGAVSPLGGDVPALWHGIKHGHSGMGPITLFDTSGYDTHFAAEVKNFDPLRYMDKKEARRTDRFVQFAIAATREALCDAGLEITPANAERVAVGIGTGIGGIGMLSDEVLELHTRGPRRVSPFFISAVLPDSASGQVAITFGAKGNNIAVTAACATGGTALGEAMGVLLRGDADVIIAGSSEAALVPICFAGFNIMKALSTRNDDPPRASRPFDKDRDGFVVGEGAGILILETEAYARARGARIYAELTGFGHCTDGAAMIAPRAPGIARAMRAALDEAGSRPDYVNVHAPSTVPGDSEEARAMKEVFGERMPPFSSTKRFTGHPLGACGVHEAVYALLMMRDGFMAGMGDIETPDPCISGLPVVTASRAAHVGRAMSVSFGFGGSCASLMFDAWGPPDAGRTFKHTEKQ
jgi:beta-ketoacyl-acyl-carrier-protein synthase II